MAIANSFELPSNIGNSWLSTSTIALSIPNPDKADIKCSIVEIETCLLEIVVHNFAGKALLICA